MKFIKMLKRYHCKMQHSGSNMKFIYEYVYSKSCQFVTTMKSAKLKDNWKKYK